MTWALVVVVIIGVGLPVDALAVTRRPPPPRPGNRLGVGYDPIDKWLLDRYQLPPHDRWQVRGAVFGGHKVSDAWLAGTAHGLAADLLARRPWTVRFWRVLSWVMLLGAIGFAVEGIVLLVTRSEGVARGVLALIDSGIFVLVSVSAKRNSQRVQRNVTKAFQLNQER